MFWWGEGDLEPRLTQTLRRKTNQTKPKQTKPKQNKTKQNKTKQNKANRGVNVQCKVCAYVECVKQVIVVLCDCDPLVGVPEDLIEDNL